MTHFAATKSSRARRILFTLLASATLLSGCAAPIQGLGGVTSPVEEPTSSTSGLIVHAPTEEDGASLPTPKAADAWLATLEAGDAKAKQSPATGATDTAKQVPVTRECPRAEERVLLIGDSLSVGLAPHMKKQAKSCGTSFHAHGVVGSHVTQWVSPSWVDVQLERAKPTVVMISMGGNDFVRNDPDNVDQATHELVAKIENSGARLLWISPPTMPFPDQVGARGMWLSALEGEMNVDWYPTEQLQIERVADQIHPTHAENAKLSRTLWQWMSTVTQAD